MINQEPAGIYQGPEDYRGSIVYTQEYGYKTVGMMINVAPDEQSHVITHDHDVPVSEEAERIQGTDLYHFAVTDGTRIQLTIETAAAAHQDAWYTVHPDSIVAKRPSFDLDIVRSDDSLPFEYVYSQEAFNEARTHYADHIPNWLDETPRSSPPYELHDFSR